MSFHITLSTSCFILDNLWNQPHVIIFCIRLLIMSLYIVSGSKEKKKTVIANKMLCVLLKYLDVCMTKNFPQEGNMSVLKEYFATVVPPCVNLCITLKRKDIVFENVWTAFQIDPFAKATFLECLESYILSDQLRNLPVNISQEFVRHYEITERFMALEACITHLNVTSLDIHQVRIEPSIYAYDLS